MTNKWEEELWNLERIYTGGQLTVDELISLIDRIEKEAEERGAAKKGQAKREFYQAGYDEGVQAERQRLREEVERKLTNIGKLKLRSSEGEIGRLVAEQCFKEVLNLLPPTGNDIMGK